MIIQGATAVVSGRDLDTLTQLTGLADSDVTRIGSHGGESSAANAVAALTGDQRAELDAVTAELEEVTRRTPVPDSNTSRLQSCCTPDGWPTRPVPATRKLPRSR